MLVTVAYFVNKAEDSLTEGSSLGDEDGASPSLLISFTRSWQPLMQQSHRYTKCNMSFKESQEKISEDVVKKVTPCKQPELKKKGTKFSLLSMSKWPRTGGS